MSFQILFLDIDGTILTSQHTYSTSTKTAIIQAQARDIKVFLATGRPTHELNELADELSVDAFIGYNGAYAVYQNKTIVNHPFSVQFLKKILQQAEDQNDPLILYTHNANYFTRPDNPKSKKFMNVFQLQENAPWDAAHMNDVLGITLIHSKQPNTYLQADSALNLAPVNVHGLTDTYDILRKDVHKGDAVKKVLTYLDIPIQNAIAFGDGMNDKEMLQTVGTGIAMGNAHPDLFQYATQMTTSVNDSGIQNGLKKIGVIE